MHRRLTRGAALAAAAALTLAACGDDDSSSGPALSGEEAEYADALAAAYQESPDAPAELSDEQAECLASTIVDVIGVDRFREADVQPDDITADIDLDEVFGGPPSDEQAEQIGDGIGECIDLKQLMVDSITEGSEVPDEAVECLEDNLDEELIQDFVVASLASPEEGPPQELLTPLLEVFQECPGLLEGGQ